MNKLTLTLILVFTFIAIFIFSCKKEESPKTVATIGSFEVTEITDKTIVCKTEVLNDGGSDIIKRGVCWSTQKNPTISMNSTNDGTALGTYESNISGLIQTGKYYVRPYVTNTFATAYGETVEFQTKEGDGKQVIDYDGHIYNTVLIGNQTWLTENSYAKHYQNGKDVYSKKQSFAFLDSHEGNTTGSLDFKNSEETAYYGESFTWEKLMDERNICPTGWHPSTDTEWFELINFRGGYEVAGGKLKEVGLGHWQPPNKGATDQYGFSALPSGYNNSVYVGVYAYWWSATEYDSINALGWYLKYDEISAVPIYANKKVGLSVRCIKD